jgi:hypothetical protein
MGLGGNLVAYINEVEYVVRAIDRDGFVNRLRDRDNCDAGPKILIDLFLNLFVFVARGRSVS